MPDDEYRKLVERVRAWYKAVHAVYCPCLQANIIFNANGFRHLLYDGKGAPRSREERIRRLMLVKYAPSIIQTAQDVAWRRKIGNIYYLTFRKQIPEHDHVILVRVIVKKTTPGNHYYHSVMDEPNT